MPVRVHVDDRYDLKTNITAGVVINARETGSGKKQVTSPNDGQLDLMLIGKLSLGDLMKHRKQLLSNIYEGLPGVTLIHGKKFEIEGPKNMMVSSNLVPVGSPLIATVSKKRVRIIIGKGRE